MEAGVQKKGHPIDFKEVGICANFLPPTEDRERPSHHFLQARRLSRKKETDEITDDPLEKGDQRIEEAQIEQADDDKKTVWLKASQGILELGRREAHEDLGAI